MPLVRRPRQKPVVLSPARLLEDLARTLQRPANVGGANAGARHTAAGARRRTPHAIVDLEYAMIAAAIAVQVTDGGGIQR